MLSEKLTAEDMKVASDALGEKRIKLEKALSAAVVRMQDLQRNPAALTEYQRVRAENPYDPKHPTETLAHTLYNNPVFKAPFEVEQLAIQLEVAVETARQAGLACAPFAEEDSDRYFDLALEYRKNLPA